MTNWHHVSRKKGDKFSYDTWAQARRDIPTLNLDPSAADTFYWLTHLYIRGEYKWDSHSFPGFAHSTYSSLALATHSILSILNHHVMIGGKVLHFVAASNLSASHMWVEGLDKISHLMYRDLERSLYAECFVFCFVAPAHHVAFQRHFTPAGRHKSNTSLDLALKERNSHTSLLCEHMKYSLLKCQEATQVI